MLIVALLGDPAGRPELARRGGAAIPADRLALCGDRVAGEPARPVLRGREEHGASSMTASPVLVVEGTIVNLTTPHARSAAAAPRAAQQRGHEVYAWTALPPKRRSARATGCRSARGSPRRRPTGATSSCASSTGAMPSPDSVRTRLAVRRHAHPRPVRRRGDRRAQRGAGAGDQGRGAASTCWSSRCSRAASSSPPT